MSTIPAVSANPVSTPSPVTTAATPPPPPPVATDTTSSAVTAPVDTVSISPEGYVLMEEFVKNPADQVLVDISPQVTLETISVSQTFSSGTTVSVYSEVYKLPEELDMNKAHSNELLLRLLPDPKVMAKVDKEDGTSETFEITADTIFSEDENGNLVIRQNFTQSDEDGNQVMNGSDGNDLIVSLTDNNIINSGEGDDTIFLFSNKNTVSLGDGNNTVSGYGHMSEGNLITGGNGNNSVEKVDGKIVLGDGNNTIRDTQSAIILGDGNNTIDVMGGHIANKDKPSAFALGNGILVGNGNNTINADVVHGLKTGNGNNTINIGFTGFEGDVIVGNGNNLINIDTYQQWGVVSTGSGNNVITIDKVIHIGSGTEAKGYSSRGMGVLLADTASDRGISIGANTKVLTYGMEVGDDIRQGAYDFLQLDKNIMKELAKKKEEEQRTTVDVIVEMFDKRIEEVESLQELIESGTLDTKGKEEVKNRLIEIKEEGEVLLPNFTSADSMQYNDAVDKALRSLEELL